MIESSVAPRGAEVLAEALAARIVAVPGVARLSGGSTGEVATYLPGRRVTGVRIGDRTVTVHVVARWVHSLPSLADDIRAAVAPLVAGRPVDVHVDDVEAEALEVLTGIGAPIDDRGGSAWTTTLV